MTTLLNDVKLDFGDVLLLPKRSEVDSRSRVSLVREYKFKHSSYKYEGIPIIAANMDHTGTFNMAIALASYEISTALHKFYTEEQLAYNFYSNLFRDRVFYSLGITDADYNKLINVNRMMANDASAPYETKFICIDVANGYSRKFVSFVERIRREFPDSVIMAGNVVTPDMTYDLLERGADIVKIGIGPGSVCTTRHVTGVGYPQLSAIMECADAAHGAGGHICADGGVTCPGDIVKAFAAGADFVMCGGLFAGHDECEGKKVYGLAGGKPTAMKFHGMSSQEAMEEHYGERASYRAAEGKAVEIPYKGPVKDTVETILGGLRSACTYVGAKNLKQLPKCATFVRVNRQLNSSLDKYNV
jgi:GMP reductase